MEAGQSKPRAIIIAGPTGVGKTSFAIKLATRFQGQIIGADSMQIYRHMDIGTAKPTPEERSMVRHHMLDIVNPEEPFDAETYASRSLSIIREMQVQGIAPFVVGGTGLYIKALVHGLFDALPVNKTFRARLKQEAEKEGAAVVYQRLKRVDPETANTVHVNDTYRIIRALEVYEATGSPISEYRRAHRFRNSRLTTLKFGLHLEREQLYRRIDDRVEAMIHAGLLDEVKRLRDAGYSGELKSMQSIGYRHMFDFLEGRLTWSEALRTMKRDTRRYAKRQMTWFRADREIVWVDPLASGEVEDSVGHFLLRSAPA